jgi:hypothetical protein
MNGFTSAASEYGFNQLLTSAAGQPTTFADWARIYRGMQAQLNAAGIDTVWFGVAGDLNQFFSSYKDWMFGSGAYLDGLGQFLLEKNETVFNDLMASRTS